MNANIEKMIIEIEDIDRKIFDVNQTIADKVNQLNAEKHIAKAKLDDALAKEAVKELADKDYGCGTANIETSQFKAKVVVSKKVKWDEKQLHVIRKQIVDAGQDPSAYIKEKLSVSETDYKSFSDDIKDVFTTARSVEPSAPKITIERK